MAGPVLDSYALLAYLRDERALPWCKNLEKAGRKGANVLMCDVQLCRVQYITRRKNGESSGTGFRSALVSLPIEFVPPVASWLIWRRISKSDPASLADAFAAATGQGKEKTDLVTATRISTA